MGGGRGNNIDRGWGGEGGGGDTAGILTKRKVIHKYCYFNQVGPFRNEAGIHRGLGN